MSVILRPNLLKGSCQIFGKGIRKVNFVPAANLYNYNDEHAHMTAVFGDKYPYDPNPWPYEKKRLNSITEYFDFSIPRMCGNSKFITVDGNLASGKNEFAKQLARNFDLKYIPGVEDKDLYLAQNGSFNSRDLNRMLPKRSQFYDLSMWLSEEDPTNGYVGQLQSEFYEERFKQACLALLHIFSTGQGAVMVRSPWSDFVFVEAMRRLNYITKPYKEFYNTIRDNSVCDLLTPHIFIYLDIPPSVVMDRIRKRNSPGEVGSTTITEKFVHEIDDIYKKKFLPEQVHSEVIQYNGLDFQNQVDYEAAAEDIQKLTLVPFDCDDRKFVDWFKLTEDEMAQYRQYYHLPNGSIDATLNTASAVDCPEILCHPDDRYLVENVSHEHPAHKYKDGYAPQQKSLLKQMFSIF